MPAKILLIDDNEDDLLFTRIALQRSGREYEIVEFQRAEEALELLRSNSTHGIDIILLDINMPGMDGFGFLIAFDQLTTCSNVTVVMLTSSADPADLQRASPSSRVRGYLQKPLTKVDAAGLADLKVQR